MKRKKVIILGAAGRDFHNFNVYFRNNPYYEVVCFTAEQIPNISNRKYPPILAGKLYPKGIPIHPEEQLPEVIKKYNADQVVLAYSDLSNQQVMEKASLALACGCDFRLMGPKSTMLKSKKPVISVCAVRTGAGKSPTTRKISHILAKYGIKFAIVRHPMPYGVLSKEIVQKFSTYDDLKKYKCTIEEIEEYEPHIANGFTVFAGVDYEKILAEAEKSADVIIFDGGNNDMPFYKPDLHIVLADARRPGHEVSYYPGAANFRMADVIIINKAGYADKEDVKTIENNARKLTPKAIVIKAGMPITVDNPLLIRNKSVLCIEDGPTLTHGGMDIGAAFLASEIYKAKTVIDPRKYASGSIKEAYKNYPQMGKILPALGYGEHQMKELQETINRAKCDTVVIGTPIDLRRYIKINKPAIRAIYELQEFTKPDLETVVSNFLKTFGLKKK